MAGKTWIEKIGSRMFVTVFFGSLSNDVGKEKS